MYDLKTLKQDVTSLDNGEVVFKQTTKEALILVGYAHLHGMDAPYCVQNDEIFGISVRSSSSRLAQIEGIFRNDVEVALLQEYANIQIRRSKRL